MTRTIYRSESDRLLGGVAAGLAERFDWDPSLTRLTWLLAAVFSGGLAVVLYVALWLIAPTASRAGEIAVARAGNRGEARARSRRTGADTAVIIGAVLIVAGALALLGALGGPALWHVGRIGALWPLLLVGLGAALLLRRRGT